MGFNEDMYAVNLTNPIEDNMLSPKQVTLDAHVAAITYGDDEVSQAIQRRVEASYLEFLATVHIHVGSSGYSFPDSHTFKQGINVDKFGYEMFIATDVGADLLNVKLQEFKEGARKRHPKLDGYVLSHGGKPLDRPVQVNIKVNDVKYGRVYLDTRSQEDDETTYDFSFIQASLQAGFNKDTFGDELFLNEEHVDYLNSLVED